MNNEKQIAQTIIDAQKMYEESYVQTAEQGGEEFPIPGEHKLDIETCLKTAGEKNGLSSNMWYLLSLAMHWWNDIQLWAKDIMAGKNINDQLLSKKDIDAAREKLVAEVEAANAEMDAAETETTE